MHRLQDPVGCGLQWQMNMFDQLWQPSKRLNGILPKADRVRRRKPDTLKAVDLVNSFKQLDKRAFPIHFREFVAPIQVDDLTQQGYLFNASRDQGANLVDNLMDGSAPFRAARVGNDAKRAVHIAALHDRHESSYLPRSEQMIANGALRVLFVVNVNDGETDVVHRPRQFAFEHLINIFRDTMKFLRPDDDVEMRHIFKKRRTPALRHAPQKPVYNPAIPKLSAQQSHFSQCFLLSQIADAAGIEKNYFGFFLAESERVAVFE
jgi:hypothetical protein